MEQTYFHLVCSLKKSIAAEANRLAKICFGSPTATQYLPEYQHLDHGEELFIFTTLEDANTFVRAAFWKYGESFELLHFNQMPDGHAGYYFRDRMAFVKYRVVSCVNASTFRHARECGAQIVSSSRKLVMTFGDIKTMNAFLRKEYTSSNIFYLWTVQGLCGD